MEALIKRLNELTKISKERSLSVEETIEREKLRNEYRTLFRENVKSHLATIKVVDENGEDITPEPLKKLKEK